MTFPSGACLPTSPWRRIGFGCASALLFLAGLIFIPHPLLAQEETPPPATINELLRSTDVKVIEQRADLFMVRKYYEEASTLYRRLTELQPNNALYFNKLGISYHQLQNLDMAKKSYRRAVQLNPQYAQAVNNLAAIEYAQKNYRPAILTYLKALQLTPGDAVMYSNLGTAYFAYEKFDYAVASYRYALLLDPNVFQRSGRVGTIVQQREEKNSAAFNFYLAKTYASVGDAENTLQFLRKAWEEGYPDILKSIQEEKTFEFLAQDQRFLDLLALMQPKDTAADQTAR
ncbi:MAG: tetratricopeptide repeat protein [Acidobacteria bacterium]|nr:tetratricopeptide repeat protein [Acidobacteriota bacterium]